MIAMPRAVEPASSVRGVLSIVCSSAANPRQRKKEGRERERERERGDLLTLAVSPHYMWVCVR